MPKLTTTSTFDQATLEILSLNLLSRFDDLIEEFGLELRQDAFMYFGACPIHNGDNRTAFNLYKEADSDGRARAGYWCCRTKGCQNKFRPTPIGFVRGILSKDNPMIGFKETIDWVCGFLGEPIDGIKIDESRIEQRGFTSTVRKLTKENKVSNAGISRLEVRRKLEIPANFFLARQYPAEILDRFDVGYCPDMSKPMGGRVVVPVYGENNLLAACSGRTIQARCCKCGMHHAGECPHKDPYKHLNFCKWRHSGQINSYLYNFASAKSHIKKSGTVIIVEGPGDVWRLIQYGVENAVALTGTALSDSQQIILEMSGAANVIDLLDNDDAGQAGSKELARKLSLYMKVVKPIYSTKDVGELTKEQFELEVKPIIQRLS